MLPAEQRNPHCDGDLRVSWGPIGEPDARLHIKVGSLQEGARLLDTMMRMEVFERAHSGKGGPSHFGVVEVWSDDAQGDGQQGWAVWTDPASGDDDPILYLEDRAIAVDESGIQDMDEVSIARMAALAAGLDYRDSYDENITGPCIVLDGFPEEWDPLHNDGLSAMLQARLRLQTQVRSTWDGVEIICTDGRGITLCEELDSDALDTEVMAVMREVVVKAAATIWLLTESES